MHPLQAHWSEITALLVSLCSLVATIYAARAVSIAALASERSATEAKRTNDVAIHGLRRAIYADVLWIRCKIIATPLSIDRNDIIKLQNAARYSQFYFNQNAYDRLRELLDEIDKYQLAEFKEHLSKAEVVSELCTLADQARDALEPRMSLTQ